MATVKKKKETLKGDWMMVWVEWYDSVKFKSPWWTFQEIEEETLAPSIMTSVGYLFHEDDIFIYLATSIHWEKGTEVAQFGNIITIPKGAIRQKKALKT